MTSANRRACKVPLREEILEVAGRQFFTRGYEGVSLNSVAREARLYPATLRLFFPDKEALYLAVALRGHSEPGCPALDTAGRRGGVSPGRAGAGHKPAARTGRPVRKTPNGGIS